MLTGDIGRLAELARDDAPRRRPSWPCSTRSSSCSPRRPRTRTRSSRRLGPEVWVEDKYDGIRAQLHKRGPDVRLYSRDLHDVSGQFPEVVERPRPLAWDGILDGEILAWKDGLVLPFIALQARLGPQVAVGGHPGGRAGHLRRLRRCSRSGRGRWRADRSSRCCASRFATAATPRRARPAVGDGGRPVHPLASSRSADDAEPRGRVRRRPGPRNEGLMVKDPTSGYSPGRRGLGWLKMKKALATIDCVVVGVEVGHGKRHGVLSDYTFAVRDTATRPAWSRSARPTAA